MVALRFDEIGGTAAEKDGRGALGARSRGE